ncbi:MAG: hypothetical protein ACE5O2_11385 [Armatimonadota bacterium]
MPPDEIIRQKVFQLAGRLRALYLQSRIAVCAFVAAALSVLLMAAHKTGYFSPVYEASATVMIVGLLAGLAWGLLRPITLLQAAALTDERLNLRERLSTAIQFASREDASAMVPALMSDASATAERIRPERVFPYRPPRHVLHLCVAGLAFFALARFCPDDLLKTPSQIAVERAMRREGKKTIRLARRAKKRAEAENLEVSREAAKKLERLGRRLEKARLSKKQALLQTQKLTKEIREKQRRLAEKNTPKNLAAAAKALKKAGLKTEAARAVAKAVGEMKLAEAANKLEEAAKKAESGELSPQERKNLAEDLGKLSDALAKTGATAMAETLQKAAESLNADNSTEAADNIRNSAAAAKEYAKYMKDAEALAQMKDAMDAMKDAMANADKPCEHGKPGGVGCEFG